MPSYYKIGIDARLYSQTGVGTYLSNLIHYLDQIASDRYIFYIYLLKEDWNKINLKKKNFIKKETNFYWHSFSEQLGFLQLLNKDRLDLMYFSYFSHPILYRRPFFSTIHDLTPLYFKTGTASTKNFIFYQIKHFGFRLALNNQVKNSLAIITPTQFVKKEIIRIYGEKYRRKIYPLYEGVNYQLIKEKENLKLKKRFRSSFFIYLGNFYPHKNIERLIKAYFLSKEIFPQLILVGPNDFFKKRLVKLVSKLELENKILFYTPQSLADIVFFYKNAKALIHPSLSEGFGLPLIEAAYFNCPVIASNIEVFKEIMDNQYLSFDPLSEIDINHKIKLFLKKKPSFDLSSIKNNYSFKKMTEGWLDVVQSLIK
jgi:glycosyltransferase involved in cell wall biosynthesis